MNELFQQPIPDELRASWAARLAERKEHRDDATQSLMVFGLGSELFGISAKCVDEIIVPGVISPLPHRRNTMMQGVTNVRGTIRPCIRLDQLLHTPASAPGPSSRLLVLVHEGWKIAALVSLVQGMQKFRMADKKALPPTHSGDIYCDGWYQGTGQLVARLNEETLFTALRKQLL